VLPPDFRDTAPYHSRVAVFSAPATTVGLTANQTRFRYRAVTFTTDRLTRDTSAKLWLALLLLQAPLAWFLAGFGFQPPAS
jgi:hypothetical protein